MSSRAGRQELASLVLVVASNKSVSKKSSLKSIIVKPLDINVYR
jgi:hypothetical protein